jgi:hypothetical protein
MWTKRLKDLFAAFVLGNGILDLIAPRQRLLLWLFGPEDLRKAFLWFADQTSS